MNFLLSLILLGGVQSIQNGMSIRYSTLPFLLVRIHTLFMIMKLNLFSLITLLYLLLLILFQLNLSVSSPSDQTKYLLNISFSGAVTILFLELRIWQSLSIGRFTAFMTIAITIYSVISIYLYLFYPDFLIMLQILTRTEVSFLNFTRLYLPMGTTAQLGYVCVLLMFLIHFSKRNTFLLPVLLFILLGTAANSSIVPLFLIFISAQFMALNNPRKFIRSGLLIVLSVIACLVVYSAMSFIRGDGNISDSAVRHFMLRENALNVIFSREWNLLTGIGVGQSLNIIDGRYTFTVWLTSLLEQGVIGFLYVIFFYIYLVFLSGKKFLVVPVFVVLASQLYQINTDITFYVLPILVLKLLKYTDP